MTKSMKAVRDRKTDNRRISQNMEKAFKKMAQVFGYPNREYKDRVFRMLLKEPKVALEVYNAMNGTLYDNPDELIITTLENAVYLGMKNDVSFILGTQLVLYEHQSTPNLTCHYGIWHMWLVFIWRMYLGIICMDGS